jgi:multiple sugar transport system ATP-binding protein
MAEITFSQIEKRFKDVRVINRLNLTIADQEFFTFVGPSGCGKSTVLNMVAGLEPVSAGTIAFDGQVINTLPPGERDVAMVFQSYALYPHMTVRDNIAFPLKVKKFASETINVEIARMARLLGLEHLLSRLPKELSGGQRQRVALGRAIVRKPRVFLMDEPLSNLDARLRVEMRAELKKLHQTFPITTVYVTHDQEEAMTLSDRVAVLYEGEIHQCAHPLEVYSKPATLFVANFMGSPPMNVIDGDLVRGLPFLASLMHGLGSQRFALGIRPADIRVGPAEGGCALEGDVVFTEATGSETWVDGMWRGVPIRGKASPGYGAAPAKPASFNFSLENVHLFDKQSGKRIN